MAFLWLRKQELKTRALQEKKKHLRSPPNKLGKKSTKDKPTSDESDDE